MSEIVEAGPTTVVSTVADGMSRYCSSTATTVYSPPSVLVKVYAGSSHTVLSCVHTIVSEARTEVRCTVMGAGVGTVHGTAMGAGLLFGVSGSEGAS